MRRNLSGNHHSGGPAHRVPEQFNLALILQRAQKAVGKFLTRGQVERAIASAQANGSTSNHFRRKTGR